MLSAGIIFAAHTAGDIPIHGKSDENVEPATYTLPVPSRAMASANSPPLPPRNVAARMELRSEFSLATKASLIMPANVLSADPASTPGKSDEPVSPATYTFPVLSRVMALPALQRKVVRKRKRCLY